MWDNIVNKYGGWFPAALIGAGSLGSFVTFVLMH